MIQNNTKTPLHLPNLNLGKAALNESLSYTDNASDDAYGLHLSSQQTQAKYKLMEVESENQALKNKIANLVSTIDAKDERIRELEMRLEKQADTTCLFPKN